LLALLALAVPIAAWANTGNIVFNHPGGVLSSNGSIITLSNSTLTGFTGLNGIPITGNLGTVSFSTGALISGSLGTSAVLGGGGSFTIAGTGSNGLPNGVLFQGSFSGPVNWIGTFNPAGNGGKGAWTYVLTGTVSGLLANGSPAAGGTVELTFDVHGGKGFGKGNPVRLNTGTTTVTVPEPGTLGLLGTGLLGIAGLIRRKFKA